MPGLHLLDPLLAPGPQASRLAHLLWFTAGRAVEDRVLAGLATRLGEVPFERVALRLEPAGGGAPSLAGLAVRLVPAVWRARGALLRHRSNVLLGLGGFTSLPAVLAAKSLRIPIALLEINAVPGRATRRLARHARVVFHAWPSPEHAGDSKHVHVGPPLARELTADPADLAERARAWRSRLALAPEAPLLLVLGGSQGALGLNRFVAAHLARWKKAGLGVLHQVGPGRLAEAAPAAPGYHALEYLDDVPGALAASALVLCRGGASTLAELAALARPAVVVPYPHHADRHQERNARSLGAGVRIVQEAALDADQADALARLAGPAGAAERAAMATALFEVLPRDASERIARELRRLACE